MNFSQSQAYILSVEYQFELLIFKTALAHGVAKELLAVQRLASYLSPACSSRILYARIDVSLW